MEKHISGLLTVLAVLCLLVGGLVGHTMAPVETEVVTETETVYQNITVDKIVEVPAPSALDNAVAIFLEAVENEEDEAGNAVNVLGIYNFDELSVLKVYDEYTVAYDDDKTTVNFDIRLQLDDGDDRVKNTYDVTVITEEGEDTIVTVA